MKSSRLALIEQWALWVINLRWLVMIGLIIVLTASEYWWRFPLDYVSLWGLSAFLLFYNLISYFLTHEKCGFTLLVKNPDYFTTFAYLEIGIDLLLLTLFLHFGGGIENPFLFFYIFHVSISSILFTRDKAYLNAILACILLNLLLWAEYSELIMHYHLSGMFPPTLYKNSFYIICLGGVLSLTFIAASYISSFLLNLIYEQEDKIERSKMLLQEQSARCEVSFADLQALHKEKTDFLRKAAHELRAPLAAIQSCLQVVLECFSDKLPDKPRELIERAERRSGSMIELVHDLLNLSRANEVLQKSKFEYINLHDFLENLIELVKPNAAKNQISIDAQLGARDLMIKADKGGLEELFTNLISNSVKYSLPKTQVRVQVQASPQGVEISFCDQGIGIAQEDLPLLFSEFFRAGNAKAMRVEGTGLGLALSKKIVEIHGGEILVESELGKGSCFKVKLPKG